MREFSPVHSILVQFFWIKRDRLLDINLQKKTSIIQRGRGNLSFLQPPPLFYWFLQSNFHKTQAKSIKLRKSQTFQIKFGSPCLHFLLPAPGSPPLLPHRHATPHAVYFLIFSLKETNDGTMRNTQYFISFINPQEIDAKRCILPVFNARRHSR